MPSELPLAHKIQTGYSLSYKVKGRQIIPLGDNYTQVYSRGRPLSAREIPLTIAPLNPTQFTELHTFLQLQGSSEPYQIKLPNKDLFYVRTVAQSYSFKVIRRFPDKRYSVKLTVLENLL